LIFHLTTFFVGLFQNKEAASNVNANSRRRYRLLILFMFRIF